MSRLLIQEAQEKELRRLQASLSHPAKKTAVNTVSLSKKDARNLVNLIQAILTERPIVIEEYLTPNEAARLSNISRPVIIEMLKNRALLGHLVGKHWRVKKDSLVEYMNTRDFTSKIARAEDEDGFGFDK
jgi:excisionase family DNA binding protein